MTHITDLNLSPHISSPVYAAPASAEGIELPWETSQPTHPFIPSENSPVSCIICTEDFSDAIRPPGWISLACLHEPSVCRSCVAKCIKSDLDNKIWNQIKCTECDTL